MTIIHLVIQSEKFEPTQNPVHSAHYIKHDAEAIAEYLNTLPEYYEWDISFYVQTITIK